MKTSYRFATYNCSLSRRSPNALYQDIKAHHPQVLAIQALIKRLNPDVLLLNEFDYAPSDLSNHRSTASDLFVQQLNAGLDTAKPYHYYTAPVNTGVLSEIDFNNDGKLSLPTDGYGFGVFPGQYGMLLLIREPIKISNAKTFQHFLWRELSLPNFPVDSQGQQYFSDADKSTLRLSSKSHWDITLQPEASAPEQIIHCLISHPTPPVFDGAERRNYHRNAAEIRFWLDYIAGMPMKDDSGEHRVFESENQPFVIMGDLNNDPDENNGDGDAAIMQELLHHPLIQDTLPSAPRFTSGKTHTAKFSHGKLRVDYVLPSKQCDVINSAVWWHPKDSSEDWSMRFNNKPLSDHYPVWVDIRF